MEPLDKPRNPRSPNSLERDIESKPELSYSRADGAMEPLDEPRSVPPPDSLERDIECNPALSDTRPEGAMEPLDEPRSVPPPDSLERDIEGKPTLIDSEGAMEPLNEPRNPRSLLAIERFNLHMSMICRPKCSKSRNSRSPSPNERDIESTPALSGSRPEGGFRTREMNFNSPTFSSDLFEHPIMLAKEKKKTQRRIYFSRSSIAARQKGFDQSMPEAGKEISLSPGRWPSIVHHCTQAKEIWVQYHQLLPQFGLRLNEDTFRIEKEFLSNFNNEFVNFAFVGLTPTKRSSISKMILNMISNDANLATIFDHAESRSRVFENICSRNQIAPLVIISNVDAEKSAFLYAEKYRYAIKPERECVVVVVCKNKQCSHNERDLNRLIAYTCERKVTMIQKDISILLKRWTYKILAQRINAMKILFDSMKDCQLPTSECIQQLCVHGIEKDGAVQHIDDRIRSVRKLKELLEESRETIYPLRISKDLLRNCEDQMKRCSNKFRNLIMSLDVATDSAHF
ncbi:uncharacterized protein LOC128224503 isoform X2 [Mya arenaria]|uniref:uncharacterized protein LOC128224503 isoform X2 n=1 Tax=Mya arenaria TaxID=6604 RepID=UPI0022E4BB29|nr:uncharacterized protein LOC128224503 isoform X2 [Mya arenaria]